jgi:hypothetical protein
MQSAATAQTGRGGFTARAVVLAFVACFLCALTGAALPEPTPASSQAAFANHKTGVATIPRQGVSARLSAAPQREHAKSPAVGGPLGLPGLAVTAVADSRIVAHVAPSSSGRHLIRAAHRPRGPPPFTS